MKPIQTYPSMRAAVRELGPEGFVTAVLGSRREAPSAYHAHDVKREPLRGRAAFSVLASGGDRRTSRH